jgi:pimeloyl-ACP methyl ester carboxylesterase
MKSTVVPSNSLAYGDRGTGTPIVFVHGLTFNRAIWEPITDRLVDRFRCIAVDLPGHGESTGLPHSMEEVGRAVHQVVTNLGIERPVVVGHSLGAMMVTKYAANFPVAGVVNVDQSLDVRPFAQMLRQMEPGLRGPNFSSVFEPIRQSIGVEMLPEPLRSRTRATQAVRQDLILAYWDEAIHQSPDDLQAMTDEAAHRVGVPYLAVFGRTLADEERKRFHDRLVGLELEEWPDRGHMVHLMEPDRFADRVAAFIDGHNIEA